MAQVGNLIVTGTNRCLNTIYASNVVGGILRPGTTLGQYSSAFGNGVEASGNNAHSEGYGTQASGNTSHAEGSGTRASGDYSHAECGGTTASGMTSHAEGSSTTASGMSSHAQGLYTTASGDYSHAEGANTTASGMVSHAEGADTTASGEISHAEGDHTTANHKSQHVFGEYNIADTSTAAATARGNYVEIVGNGIANDRSNARTLDWSGNEWIANSLVVGSLKSGTTIGQYATAFGGYLTASGSYSHAEGYSSQASGNYSHAEGNSTTASGQYGAHSEGGSTTASGNASHAEGFGSTASGYYSHADGYYTTASHKSQHVFGEYNALDTSTAAASARGTYVEIVGKGSSNSARSNARTLNWNGNEWIAGTLTQGSSIEIKKNVKDMTQEDGDKILNLRPVVFDYKSSEKDIQAERGFIAEEVKEIIPNLVTDKIVNDNGDTVAPASLNYIAMIPYLVKVCQRQQEEIDELKSLIGK